MQLNNVKIGTRLGAAFAVTALMLVLVSVFAIWKAVDLGRYTNDLSKQRIPQVQMSNALVSNALNIGKGIRNLILTSDKKIEKE